MSLIPKWFLSAVAVVLKSLTALFILLKIKCNSFSLNGEFGNFIIFLTFMLPVVIVPVLSMHSTSVLASISKEYISCTNTFFFDKTSTPATSVVENKRYIPEGIIEINAPQIGAIISTPIML